LTKRFRVELVARRRKVAGEHGDRLATFSRSNPADIVGAGGLVCDKAGLRELEGRIVRENLALKLLELATRFEPKLVGQQRSSSLVDVERICLTAGAIERKHELRAEAFSERMLADERLDVADDRRVAARREVGLDPLLHARESELFESSDLGLSEWLVRELCERTPAPEPHRISERSVRDEALEAVEIELASFDAQLVAG
jgi:hypothetical protein